MGNTNIQSTGIRKDLTSGDDELTARVIGRLTRNKDQVQLDLRQHMVSAFPGLGDQ